MCPKIFGPTISFYLDSNFFGPIIYFLAQIFSWAQYLFGAWRLPLETRNKVINAIYQHGVRNDNFFDFLGGPLRPPMGAPESDTPWEVGLISSRMSCRNGFVLKTYLFIYLSIYLCVQIEYVRILGIRHSQRNLANTAYFQKYPFVWTPFTLPFPQINFGWGFLLFLCLGKQSQRWHHNFCLKYFPPLGQDRTL